MSGNYDGLYIGLFPIDNASTIEYIKLNTSIINKKTNDFLNIFNEYFNEFKSIDNDNITIPTDYNNLTNILNINNIKNENIRNVLDTYTNYSTIDLRRLNLFSNDRKGYYPKRYTRINKRNLSDNKHDKNDNYVIILFTYDTNNTNNINYLYTTVNLSNTNSFKKFKNDINDFCFEKKFKTININLGGNRNKTKKYNHKLTKKINTKNYKKSKKNRK